MGERRKRSKNAGRICETHRILIRTIGTKTQIGTKKERTRNDEGNCKMANEKDNEDRQRKL
jgi:hypothetical protein